MFVTLGVPGPAWTGMNDVGTFNLLPPDEVERFIRNSAQDLRRPGWLLVDRSATSPWPKVFFEAYSVSEERSFGGYTAYHLIPK